MFSHDTELALCAMVYLCRKPPDCWIVQEEIADAVRTGERRMSRVLGLLVVAGLVDVKRGLHGGFMLAKPAESVSMDEIIRAICERSPANTCVAFRRSDGPVPDQGGRQARVRPHDEGFSALVTKLALIEEAASEFARGVMLAEIALLSKPGFRARPAQDRGLVFPHLVPEQRSADERAGTAHAPAALRSVVSSAIA